MRKKVRKYWLLIVFFCFGLLGFVVVKLMIAVNENGVYFYKSGSAGAVTLSDGYAVSLDAGDAYDCFEEGMAIVNEDYKALYAQLDVVSDEGKYTVQGILDHDFGTPAALPAVLMSDLMWIRNENGAICSYEKVNSVHTGDIDTRDLMMSDGRSVLDKEYLEQYGALDELIVFVVCEGEGRRVSFWNPCRSCPATSIYHA